MIKPNGYETTSRPTGATRTPEQDANAYCNNCGHMFKRSWHLCCEMCNGYGRGGLYVKAWDTCEQWTPKREI